MNLPFLEKTLFLYHPSWQMSPFFPSKGPRAPSPEADATDLEDLTKVGLWSLEEGQ
jgi:hypothetical protein